MLQLGQKRVGFRADIQGLRAIAVLCVVLYHANLPGLTGGYIGVDVFFVISGFLITAHLLATMGDAGRISFATFYARRARRILPASITVVVLTMMAAWIWIPPLIQSPIWGDAAATASYLPNFFFANRHVDYLSDPNPSIFQHYWSLGVEEQFYLVWPALLAAAFFLFRHSSRAILGTLLSILFVSFGLCVWLTFRSQPWAFFMVPTRAWEFAVGGLAAYLVTSTRFRLPARAGRACGWIGLVSFIASVFLFNEATTFPGFSAALPVLATALIIVGGSTSAQHRGVVTSLLSTGPLVFIGTISYSMYLVHWPLLTIPQIMFSERHDLPLWATLGLAALSVPFAWVIYRLVEDPARKWRVLSARRPRFTLWIAAGLTVCLTAVALVSLQASQSSHLYSSVTVPDTTISISPNGTSVVPSNLVPGIRNASSDNPAIYASGCHLLASEVDPVGCTVGETDAPISVALFGDSHAAQWYPALESLARQKRIVLTSHTKSSCPSFDVAHQVLAASYPDCLQWRKSVLVGLESHPPGVVILANFIDGDQDMLGSGEIGEWSAAIERTVRSLSVGSVVLVIADTPHFEISPSVCLSAHLTNANACGRSPEEARSLTISAAVQLATMRGGGRFVDLTHYLCNPRLCPVIIGNTLVYRDSHHLTASFSKLMSEVLGVSIEDSVVRSNR